MKNRQIIIKVVLAFTFTFLLIVAINSYLKSQKSRPTFEGQVEKLSVGIVSETSLFVLLAEEKGYFTTNGLDVEVKKYQSGNAALADLFSGKIDLAIGADYIGARNALTRNDFLIISAVGKTEAYEIVARSDLGLTSPEDIKGKRIGVTKGTAGDYWLGVFLTYNNLEPNDVTIVDLSPSELTDAMINGEVDAMLNLEPHTYNVKKSLAGKTVSWYGQRGQGIYSLVYGQKSLVDQKSAVVERFLTALVQAEDYFNTNTNESYSFIADYFGYNDDYLQSVVKTKYEFSVSIDQAMILTLEDEARWIIKSGLTEENRVPNFLNTIYIDGLKNIKPESVTIIN